MLEFGIGILVLFTVSLFLEFLFSKLKTTFILKLVIGVIIILIGVVCYKLYTYNNADLVFVDAKYVSESKTYDINTLSPTYNVRYSYRYEGKTYEATNNTHEVNKGDIIILVDKNKPSRYWFQQEGINLSSEYVGVIVVLSNLIIVLILWLVITKVHNKNKVV